MGGSVAEWIACWTQAQKGPGNSLRQIVHIHCASVHQAAKLVAALLRVAGVTAGLAESNGSLPLGLIHVTCRLTAKNRGISSGTLRSVIEYRLPFYRAMLCIRGTSHGPVSLSVLCLFVSVCLSVCHKSEFYKNG